MDNDLIDLYGQLLTKIVCPTIYIAMYKGDMVPGMEGLEKGSVGFDIGGRTVEPPTTAILFVQELYRVVPKACK